MVDWRAALRAVGVTDEAGEAGEVGRHRDGAVSTAMVLKWIACLRLSVGRVRRSPSSWEAGEASTILVGG